MESRIDFLFATNAAHLIDRGAHRQQKVPRGLSPEALLQTTGRHRKVWGTPASVASRGAKAGDILINHRDAQCRLVKK